MGPEAVSGYFCSFEAISTMKLKIKNKIRNLRILASLKPGIRMPEGGGGNGIRNLLKYIFLAPTNVNGAGLGKIANPPCSLCGLHRL